MVIKQMNSKISKVVDNEVGEIINARPLNIETFSKKELID